MDKTLDLLPACPTVTKFLPSPTTQLTCALYAVSTVAPFTFVRSRLRWRCRVSCLGRSSFPLCCSLRRFPITFRSGPKLPTAEQSERRRPPFRQSSSSASVLSPAEREREREASERASEGASERAGAILCNVLKDGTFWDQGSREIAANMGVT